jgi:hypothetical protein
MLRSPLDLPYMYSTEGKLKEPNMAADIGQGLLGIASSYAKKDMGGLLKGGMGVLRAATGGAQKAGEYTKKTRTSPADVVSTRHGWRRSVGLIQCRRSPGVVARIPKPARIQSRLEKLQAP